MMKKLLLTLSLATVCFATHAQNTFPTSGNVGIATNSPAYLLDVNGVIHGNHEILADGGLRVGSLPGDDVNGAPWYGLGFVSSTVLGSVGSVVQLASFWGLNIQTQYGQMVMLGNGNVGIGTKAPAEVLDVNGNPTFGSVTERLSIGGPSIGFNRRVATGAIYDNTHFAYQFQHTGGSTPASDYLALQVYNSIGTNITPGALVINGNGNVLIGQTSQNNSVYKLDVNGGVRANAIIVNANGADFVFEPTYKLLPLPMLKEYLIKNHHLPEIASAKEMQADGLNLGDNQIKLLQKVEELTLYLIEKDKQLNDEKVIIIKQQEQIDSQQGVNIQQAQQLQSQQEQIDQLRIQLNTIVKPQGK